MRVCGASSLHKPKSLRTSDLLKAEGRHVPSTYSVSALHVHCLRHYKPHVGKHLKKLPSTPYLHTLRPAPSAPPRPTLPPPKSAPTNVQCNEIYRRPDSHVNHDPNWYVSAALWSIPFILRSSLLERSCRPFSVPGLLHFKPVYPAFFLSWSYKTQIGKDDVATLSLVFYIPTIPGNVRSPVCPHCHISVALVNGHNFPQEWMQ